MTHSDELSNLLTSIWVHELHSLSKCQGGVEKVRFLAGFTRKLSLQSLTYYLSKISWSKRTILDRWLTHITYNVMLCYVMFGFIVVRVTMYVCYVRNLRWPITRLTGAS